MDAIFEVLAKILDDMYKAHPKVVGTLALLFISRIISKPLSILKNKKRPNVALSDKIKSKWYLRALAFILDYLFSIKLVSEDKKGK